MIDENVWCLLCELKRLTGCMFVLFGDHRQLTPVMGGYFFEHPGVMYLSGANYTELTKIHRYDNRLLAVSDHVWEHGNLPDDHDFGAIECRKSVAYHHVMRYKINTMWNLRETPDHFIQIGDWNIYKGLPIVCKKSTKDAKFGEVVRNNEDYTVDFFYCGHSMDAF